MQFREPTAVLSRKKKKVKQISSTKQLPSKTKETTKTDRKTFTPTQILQQLESLIQKSTLSSSIWVTGELINVYPKNRSGHMYFDIKDDNANKLSCTLFGVDRVLSADVRSCLANGVQVSVYGTIKCICKFKGSQYQLNVRKLEIISEDNGIHEKQLIQWENELKSEGVFQDTHKRTLPSYPQHIAVLTSEGGAALQDIKQTLINAHVPVFLHLYPCIVQGEQCVPTILKQLQTLCDECNDDDETQRVCIDMVLIARGGGSREDLWEFNQPLLLRSIDALRGVGKLPPIACAIGHQIDHPLLDKVCDTSFITPTYAAQAIAKPFQTLLTTTQTTHQHIQQQLNQHIETLHQRYTSLQRIIQSHHPQKNMLMTLQASYTTLQQRILRNINEQHHRYTSFHQKITSYPLMHNITKHLMTQKHNMQQKMRQYMESQNTSWLKQHNSLKEYQPWALLYSHPNMVILKDAQYKDVSIHKMTKESKPMVVKMLTSKGSYDVRIEML